MEVAINNTLYQQISAYAQQQGQSLTATIESILLRFIMRSKFATEQSASMKSDSAEEEPSVVAEAEAFTPRVMRFKRGNPWYATDEEVDRMHRDAQQEGLRHFRDSRL